MPASLRALVYRPGSLGDTLVSLPAIAEIRRQFPAHRLTLLTEGHAAGSTRVSPWTILKETGWFEEAYFYVVRPTSVADRYRNVALAMHLRASRFHDIFSLAPPRTTRQLRIDACIFRGVVGARRYHAASRPAWPAPADVNPAQVEHEGLRLLRIVDPTGDGTSLSRFRLAVPDTERAMGRGLLHDLGVRPDQLLVGVAPGSGRSATAWPAERFAAVGKALLRPVPEYRAAGDRRFARTATVRRALRGVGSAVAQPRGPAERVRLGIGPVAMRHFHRQRFRPDTSCRQRRHSLRGDLQRAQRARTVGADRRESRRHRRPAGVCRLHARRLRPRSEEVPDAD